MRSLKYILPALCAALLASCSLQIEDKFDRDAQSRLSDANALHLSNLLSATNGWVIEYYPQQNQNYGGYNILVRFDKEGYCYMLSEKADGFSQDRIQKSEYRVVNDQSSVLTFCTYNSYIHDFADPGVTEGEGRRYGWLGDFEFAIKSSSPDEVVTTGLKTNNTIKLYPVPANVTWEQYLTSIREMDWKINDPLFSGYSVTIDGVDAGNISVSSYPLLLLPDPTEDDPEKEKQVAFRYTPTGIKLYEPTEIGSATVHEFNLSEDGKGLYATGINKKVILTGTYVEGFIPYDDYKGTYIYTTESGTTGTWTVELKEKERNRSYTLTGLRYDITVNYNRENGTLAIANGQQVGQYEHSTDKKTYPVNAYVFKGSSLNTGSSYGLIGKNEEVDGKMKITWVDNGKWSTVAEGIGFYIKRDGSSSYTYLAKYGTASMVKQD